MGSIAVYAIAALVLVSSGFLAGKRWEEGAVAIKEAAARETVDAIKADREATLKAVGVKLAEEVGKIQVVNRTVNREVQRELREVPVYVNADCAIPDSGVRLINQTRGYTVQGGAGSPKPVPIPPATPLSPAPPGRSVTGARRLVCDVPGVQCQAGGTS